MPRDQVRILITNSLILCGMSDVLGSKSISSISSLEAYVGLVNGPVYGRCQEKIPEDVSPSRKELGLRLR